MHNKMLSYCYPIFFICFFLGSLVQAQSGVVDCKTEERSLTDFQQILQESGEPPSALGNIVYDIPVNFYIINDDDGNTSYNFLISGIEGSIAHANQAFTNGMQFYVCGVYELNNTFHHNNGNSTQVYNYIHVEEGFPKDGITVVVNRDGPKASFPSANNIDIIIMNGTSSKETFVHELGHFFNLEHTFMLSAWRGDAPGEVIPLILPDNSCNPFASPALCANRCGNDCQCETTGDYICDTNVDPYFNFKDRITDIEYKFCINPDDPCSYVDPNGVLHQYTPDYTNQMRYGNDLDHFSPQQLQVMLAIYTGHPSREYLRNASGQSCPPFAGIPQQGIVERAGFSADIGPVEGIDVIVKNNVRNDLTIAGRCEEQTTIVDGSFNLEGCVISDVYTDMTLKNPGNSQANSIVQNYVNGVSTFDIVIIRRHVLGLQSFSSPYQYLAADVNGSGTVSTLDIIKIQQLILGMVDELDVPSWRFLPKYYFSDPSFVVGFNNGDPFDAVWNAGPNQRDYFSEPSFLDEVDLELSFYDSEYGDPDTWSLLAFKSGDVNFTANIVDLPFGNPESNSTDELTSSGGTFNLDEWDIFDLEFKVKKTTTSFDLSAYQIELTFDPTKVQLADIISLDNGLHPISQDMYCLDSTNCIARLLWITLDNTYPKVTFLKKNLFGVRLMAKKDLSVDVTNLVELNTSDFQPQFFDMHGSIQPVDIFVESNPSFSNILSSYPNPATNQVSLEIPISENGSDLEVNLFQWNSSNNDSYNFSNLNSGVHTFTFDISSFNTGDYTARVCIQAPGGSNNCDNDELLKF